MNKTDDPRRTPTSVARSTARVWSLLSVVPVVLAVLLTTPTSAAAKKVKPTALVTANTEVPEELLLDVGIVLFDPGLPAQGEDTREDEGVYADIRKTEARYLPVQLMDTLQSTALWGAVRVVPRDIESMDLVVRGSIVESDGLRLELEMQAYDASGRAWLERSYKAEATPSSYREGAAQPPFQDLFNSIANDLLKAHQKLEEDEILELRRISELRFASELAPTIYGDYLGTNRRGHRQVEGLPAADDPMMMRVDRIRERDYFFIDTLSEHYSNFGVQVADSYEHWRRYSYEEELARRKLKRQARTRGILGAIAILGAVVVGGDGGSEDAARDVAVFGGITAIESGIQKAREAKIHKEALRELAVSFDTEVAPILVEIEGRTLKLSGTAEAQFSEWRDLLHSLFAEETGIPLDPDTRAPAGDWQDLPFVEGEVVAEGAFDQDSIDEDSLDGGARPEEALAGDPRAGDDLSVDSSGESAVDGDAIDEDADDEDALDEDTIDEEESRRP